MVILRILIFCGALGMLLPACKNRDKNAGGGPIAGQIYFDYKVDGSEDDGEVACRLQYRLGGPEGASLVITPPGKVQLDGQELPLDSAGFTGAFYEQVKPVEEFKGHHVIEFTYPGEDPVKEEFDFMPFQLAEELPDQVGHEDLVLPLKDFPLTQTSVQLVITDTAFATTDINQTVQVLNGKLRISGQMLQNLKDGPITIQINHQENRPLKNQTKAGGRLQLSYKLSRDVELVSGPSAQ